MNLAVILTALAIRILPWLRFPAAAASLLLALIVVLGPHLVIAIVLTVIGAMVFAVVGSARSTGLWLIRRPVTS